LIVAGLIAQKTVTYARKSETERLHVERIS
jgi:hypothetical protein